MRRHSHRLTLRRGRGLRPILSIAFQPPCAAPPIMGAALRGPTGRGQHRARGERGTRAECREARRRANGGKPPNPFARSGQAHGPGLTPGALPCDSATPPAKPGTPVTDREYPRGAPSLWRQSRRAMRKEGGQDFRSHHGTKGREPPLPDVFSGRALQVCRSSGGLRV